MKNKQPSSALDNLLHEMVQSESETEEIISNKRDFGSKVAKINSQGAYLHQQNE